jgi:hypothetical protein
MFRVFGNAIGWFFGVLEDDIRSKMSLSRVTFLLSFLIAGHHWYNSVEIMQYHFYFLLINLMYLLFRYRALDLIGKIVDMITSSKTTVLNNVVVSEDKEIKNG